jgi:hypothetical protein
MLRRAIAITGLATVSTLPTGKQEVLFCPNDSVVGYMVAKHDHSAISIVHRRKAQKGALTAVHLYYFVMLGLWFVFRLVVAGTET